MVMLVCLAFISQLLASTVMSYHMTSHSMMGMAQMPMMELNQKSENVKTVAKKSSDDSQSSTQDCCSKTCNCFTGGCSSAAVALIKSDSNYHFMIDLSSKILSNNHLARSHKPSTLYRPPIVS